MPVIAIATSTRADWGLLRPIARALTLREGVEVRVVATNMHLNPRFGMTVGEIEADGFEVAARVAMPSAEGASAADTVRAAAECMAGMADAFEAIRPDMLVILGDRYEMLAVAQAATVMRIPIVHIAGGEISEGAFDDSIRHAITKLSSLHLTATEPYRRRVVQMGEDPAMVVNTGAIGVYNLTHETPIPREELEADLGIAIDRRTLLVTLHPATMDDTPAAATCANMLSALDSFPDSTLIFTYPNNDPEGEWIIRLIDSYVAARKGRAVAVASLGWKRYLSALHYVGAVVGNSSSGIVEVPSMGIPTVDIGIRQRGRLCAPSVIHCATDASSIASAIARALSPEFREAAAAVVNPYGGPDTLRAMTDAILSADHKALRTKRFHDINTDNI